MSKTQSHKRTQLKAAGKNGRTEVKISRNRRLDSVTKSGKRVTEVERIGTNRGLDKAVQRLKARRSSQKVLQVPQKDMQIKESSINDSYMQLRKGLEKVYSVFVLLGIRLY